MEALQAPSSWERHQGSFVLDFGGGD